MVKLAKLAKTQNLEIIENTEDIYNDVSDDEIELKPIQNKKVIEPKNKQPIEEHIYEEVKPRRKLNLSEEERERRRQSMINTRAKRTASVEHKKQLEIEYLRHQEDETQNKIIKQAEKLKKKKEKELYNKYLEELNNKQKNKKKPPKIIYESESESDDSEEEVVIVKKKKSKKGVKNGGGSAPPSAPAVEHYYKPEPVQQPPPRPTFRIAY